MFHDTMIDIILKVFYSTIYIINKIKCNSMNTDHFLTFLFFNIKLHNMHMVKKLFF